MDSMIPVGQKNTLAEYMILSGADNHPPMLDKELYDSWKSIMELYMQNREHRRMILESVKHGPIIWPTIEENGVTKTKKYAELSATEKIQADCDLKATNIILQGLPSDIYSLVNHHRVAKDLWERTQLLMQGTSLTKQERECKLYDAFDNKFVTDVKLVKDLHTTNFDQLHAYLQQHELHANEVRIMRECNHDPLALVTNHQQTPSHFNTYQSSYNNPQFQQQFSPSQSSQYGSIHTTQHYSFTHPSTHLEISYPSTPYPNTFTSIVHQDSYPQPQSVPQIEYTVSIVKQQTHLAEFPPIDSGLAVRVFKQGDDPIDAINKMMSFLSTVVSSCFPTTNNQLKNSSNPRQQATIHDGIGGNNSGQQRAMKCFNCQREGHMARQCLKPKRKRDATWFRNKVLLVEAQGNAYQANDLDAYDSDYDDFSTAKAVLMANLSSYESDVLSEDTNSSAQKDAIILSVFEQLSNQVTNCNKVNKDNLIANESLSAELERYKETNVISIADSEETLMLEEESRSKMLLKQSDPMVLENKVNTKPINYVELNRLSEDFGKRFVPQRELTDEQALHPNTDQSASSPVKIEAPRELPKMEAAVQQYHVDKQCFEIQKKQFLIENDRLLDQIISQDIVNIVVNSSLDINTSVNVNSSVAMNDSVNYVEMCNKCLELEAELIKQYNMNNTSVNQTKPSFKQLLNLNNLKVELQAKDTTIEKLKANIKRLNKNSTTNSVKNEIDEIETINIELEHRVTKLIAKNEHLRQTYKQLYDSIKPSRVQAKEHAESLVNQLNQKSVEITDLNAQLQEKVFVITALKMILGVSQSTKSSRSNSTDNKKNDRTHQISSRTQKKNKVEEHSKTVKSSLNKKNCVVEPSGNANHMTGDRSQLTNFVHKFLATVKFGNDQIAKIMRHGLVRGLPKLKFEKDHLCSACAMGKSKKQSHKPKSEDTNQEKLYLLHMDLCGPMRVASMNGKKYILVIVDDYSRFTWVKFLASKDEAPYFIIKFLKMIQVRLNATVRNIRTDNGTEFVNQTLRDNYEQVGISNETLVARTPQENGVVERRNRMLVEATRTMLIFSKDHLFLWAEAIATAFAAAPRTVDLADSPVSTSIDQDAPSTSIPSTQDQEHSLIIS
ncbi:retrovirus-related pol polyprotein from transposon TNT 1-94 [Tanacetum coccineum]